MKRLWSDWGTLMLWAACVLGGLAATMAVLRHAGERQLHEDAEHTALQYAHFVASTVPGLDAILAGEGVTRDALVQMKTLRHAGDVFRFKLFDRTGRLLLTSDDLDGDFSAVRAPRETIAEHHARSAEVQTLVLEGRNHITLKSGAGRVDRPAVYSEAYVPVLRGEKVIGVVEVYVDQTGRESSIQSAFVRVAAAVIGVLLLVGFVGSAHWLHRVRAQRRAEERVRYLAEHTRGRFSFQDGELDQQLQARSILARDLREAIGTPALSLHYQPLYSADGLALTGYEALLRWSHPTRGNVSPAEFVPLAEDTGLIEPLGRWVLQQACAQAATWPHPLSVAVNLSAVQFRNDDLVHTVQEALDGAGLAARRLELEITESLLINNTEQVLRTLKALSDMGVRIAMDDFGTGYSSLAYLWRFPFDKVKIDRAFTQGLGDDPRVDHIVRSIISLAHSLQIRVNAEGVETEGQMRRLQRHGCDELQGFLLGRPVPAGQLTHDRAASRAPRRPAAQSAAWNALASRPAPL